MKIVGIIQARIGSTRLPYKMMLSLHGSPIIEWVIKRTRMSKGLDHVVSAIPDSRENDILGKYITSLGVDVFRGSESDVLSRFYSAAVQTKAAHIVRICADNPLISGKEIDHLIDFYRKASCDFAYNHIPRKNTYPDGLGAEIFSFEVLKTANEEANHPDHREHCTLYILDHPDRFSIKTFNPPNSQIARPELKLDIDTFEDYYHLAMKDFDMNVSSEEIVRMEG